MDVYVDGVQSTNVNLESNPQTEVIIIGDPQTSVDVAEEEKIGIEVEQVESVDIKIDGQIYEVGNPIPGQDGFSPIVEVEEIEGGHKVTITDVEGTKVFDVLNGQNGEDGYTPQKGVDYFDGKDGQDGRDGVDGYTPIKGVDYFTDSDKREIAQEISNIYDVDRNGQVDKADDTDKLGGKPPEYYAASEDIPSIPKKVSEFENDAGYLTEHQSLEGYAKKEDIPDKVSSFKNDAGYLTEHQSLEGYAKTSDIPTIPTKVSAFENDKGYLTEHQSLDNYYTKPEVTEELNKKQDAIDKYVETVNGYSGEVKLSASDVKALPDTTVIPTVPRVVSAFTNDADYASRTYVSEVAAGKCQAYTFETVTELDEWLKVTDNKINLNNGDVFYIREVGVPDYWWDKETQSKQILETTKVDLTDYAKGVDIPLNVSQLNNDADYITESEVDTKLGGKQDKLDKYVSSVNGKSGAVSLNCSDVGAMPADTFIPTALSQLSQDSTHRIVTDTEKATWNAKSNFSGNYNDLTNKPSIPSAYTHPSTHPVSMITGLSAVATSGSYNDLSNKPTIPSAYTHPSSHPSSMITGLSAVATSGKYSDLSGRPTILSASNKGYNGAITASADGVAEMGKYIDFHNTANGTSDYSTRLMCTGEHGNTVSLPSATGTLAVGDKAYRMITSSSAPSSNDTSVITFVV